MKLKLSKLDRALASIFCADRMRRDMNDRDYGKLVGVLGNRINDYEWCRKRVTPEMARRMAKRAGLEKEVAAVLGRDA